MHSSGAGAGGPRFAWPAPSWLALFYDLAFAAAVIAVAGAFGQDHSILGTLWFATAYGIMFCGWILTGGATSAFAQADRPVRGPMVILIVVQMAVVLMLGLVSRESISASSALFDSLLAVLLATCIGLGVLNRGVVSASRTRTMVLVAAAMAMLGLAWLLPTLLGLIAWVVALLVLAGAATVVLRDSHLSVHRYVHRLGELTLIILGEILVKIALTVGSDSAWTLLRVELAPALVLVAVVWWAYFTGPVLINELTPRRRVLLTGCHWLLHLALLGLAVGLGKLVVGSSSLDKWASIAVLLSGPVVVMIGSLALMDWVTGNARASYLGVAAAVAAVVAALAAVLHTGPAVTGYVLAIVPLIAVALGNWHPKAVTTSVH